MLGAVYGVVVVEERAGVHKRHLGVGGATTAVLVGPLHGNAFAFVKVHLTDVVAAAVVVLGIEEAVRVVAITVAFVQAVVASLDGVQVHVSSCARQYGSGGDGSEITNHIESVGVIRDQL